MDASVLLELKATAKDAKKEVKDLGRSMKQSLQQNLRSDIDIDDSEIEKTKAKLELLEQDLNTNLDIDDSSIDRFKGSAEDYVGRDSLEGQREWQTRKTDALLNDDFLSDSPDWDGMFDQFDRNIRHSDVLSDILEDTFEGRNADAILKDFGNLGASTHERPDGSDFSLNRDGVDARSWTSKGKPRYPDDQASVSALWDRALGIVHDQKGKTAINKARGREGLTAQRGKKPRDVSRGEVMRDMKSGSSMGFQSTTRDSDYSFDDPRRNIDQIHDSAIFEKAKKEYAEFKNMGALRKGIRNVNKKAKRMGKRFSLSNLNLRNMAQNAKKFGGHVKNIIPSMRTWWRLIGAMLPMMIALGVQAAGVAAALGSIAVAGGAVAGLGLLGSGDSLSESLSNAQQQIQEVKRELFDTFQPVFQAFAPMSDRFFGTLAERLRPLVDVMQELTAYEGAFNRLFGDIVGYAAMGIEGLADRVEEFEQVGRRYLSSFVSTLSRFVQFLTKTMVEEQDAIMHLGQSFAAIINIVWQAIKVLSYVGVILRPIFEIASQIATLFSNKWVASIGAMIVSLYIYVAAVNSARVALLGLMKVNFMMWAGKLVGIISNLGLAIQALQAKFIAASWAARAFWTAATLGGAAVLLGALDLTQQALQPDTTDYGSGAGGMPGSGQAGSSPTYNTQITVNGDMSKKQRNQVEDIARNVGNEQSSIETDRGF